MESPQMYDTSQPMVQIEVKKINNMASNSGANVTNNNNNNTSTINHNTLVKHQQHHLQQQQQQPQQHQQQQQQPTNGGNSILQKHMLQQYSQSDLEELTSQEISLDLQHLIDDQFRDQESMGIFTEMVTPTNGTTNGGVNMAAKALQLQQSRLQVPQGYPRTTLAYMPQPVHSGATYTNNSSDENSSVGSDATTSIKEEPVDPVEYRRQLAANGNPQFMGTTATPTVQNGANGPAIYPNLPPNYASNGSGNTFTTLTPSTVLHHQTLPHLPSAAHLANLKHKQMMSHRKQSNKHVDKGTDEYRRRRERNNIAVRKSREKAKVRSREVEEKVKTLIKEKEVLIRRLEEMTNEIQLHKQLYMHLINHSNPEINQICRSVLSVVNMSDHGM